MKQGRKSTTKQVNFTNLDKSATGKKSEGWLTDHERAANESFDLGASVASASTKGTAQGYAEYRRKALREAREREGQDPLAQFD